MKQYAMTSGSSRRATVKERSKDGVFVFYDPKLDADLAIEARWGGRECSSTELSPQHLIHPRGCGRGAPSTVNLGLRRKKRAAA